MIDIVILIIFFFMFAGLLQTELQKKEARDVHASAIEAVQAAADKYDPSLIQYQWDHRNPRIQLEPVGTRGYIELRAVKKL